MDVRTKIINDVLEKLIGADAETLEKVESILHIQLKNYDIQERCTEIIAHDDSNLGLVRKFLATKKLEGKSEKTIEGRYRPELEKLFNYINKPIKEINPYDIRLYLAVYKENRNVSNRTLENMRKVISSFFGWLHGEGFITHNPMKSVKQIKYVKKNPKPFSNVEREKIKNSCSHIRDLALIEFLYASGLRVSEVSSLNREDINFAAKEAIVIGKGGKERKFYLSDVALEYLKQYLLSRTDSNPALFVSMKKPFNRIGKSGIESSIRHLGMKAKVDNVHPHRFRRSLATNLARNNVPIQEVAEILGHADLRTTQVYVCVDQETIKYHYNKAVT